MNKKIPQIKRLLSTLLIVFTFSSIEASQGTFCWNANREVDAALNDNLTVEGEATHPSSGNAEENKTGIHRAVDAASMTLIPVLGNSGQSAASHQNDITARWNRILGSYFTGTSIYAEPPSVTAPYSAGRLEQGYLNDALMVLNFCRYLSGLPDDVRMSEDLNRKAQHGAVLMAASDYGHYPSMPDNMPENFYQQGYEATSNSNIAWSRLSFDTLPIIIYDAWMADSSEKNLDNVGHRRWLLNPSMLYVGFGQATDGSLKYFDSYIRDQSRPSSIQYHAIAYPAGPAFPSEFFLGKNPWSITLNPNLYKTPDEAKVVVTLTGNGQTWTLNNNTPNSGGNRFYVSTTKSGVNNCIIFKPSGVSRYSGEYTVLVEGLETLDGAPAYMEYTVSFFSMQRYTVNATATDGGAVSGGGIYDRHASTTLSAVSGNGYGFVGWFDTDGNKLSDTPNYSLTVTGNITIYAQFQPLLRMTAEAAEGGTATGSGEYYMDGTITFTAAANPGYSFDGWHDHTGTKISSDPQYTFVAKTAQTLQARFILDPEGQADRYQIKAVAETGGSVSGTGTFEKDEVAALSAIPHSGFSFDGWYTPEGKRVSKSAVLKVQTNSNQTLHARFVKTSSNAETYAVALVPIGEGDVLGAGTYSAGEQITISAYPNNESRFYGWYENGNLLSNSETYQFTIRSNRLLQARFESPDQTALDTDQNVFMNQAAFIENSEIPTSELPEEESAVSEQPAQTESAGNAAVRTPQTGSNILLFFLAGGLLLLGGAFINKRRKTMNK